jgi:hypothetical protein
MLSGEPLSCGSSKATSDEMTKQSKSRLLQAVTSLASRDEEPYRQRRAKQIVLLVAAVFFMENLDGVVIVTALPQMARSLSVNAIDLNIGVTAYMLAAAVFIPVSGWMVDRFGARAVFAGAIALFTLHRRSAD